MYTTTIFLKGLLMLVALLVVLVLLLRHTQKKYGMTYGPRPDMPRPRIRWKGPKTDARINRMLAECIALLKELGVPISESICPEVTLTGSHYNFGSCVPKGYIKHYNVYDFYIEISGYTLENSEKSLRNTLIHELLHTVPGGGRHTGAWKKWTDYVNRRTDYNIQRCDGDETKEDILRLENGGYNEL